MGKPVAVELILIAACGIMVVTGCGVKGDPMPPLQPASIGSGQPPQSQTPQVKKAKWKTGTEGQEEEDKDEKEKEKD
jgi:hypothetical protein